MQEASGADFIIFNWSAQPSSDDLSADRGLHSLPRISLPPLISTIVRRADALDAISRGGRLGVSLPRRYLRRIAMFTAESSALIRRWMLKAVDCRGTVR